MPLETPEQIKARAEAAVPGAQLSVVKNDSPCAQHSLLVDVEHAYAVAQFLRDDPQLRLDYCSNVTGVDFLDAELSEKVKVKKVVDGVEKEVEEVKTTSQSAMPDGLLENLTTAQIRNLLSYLMHASQVPLAGE